MVSKVKIGKRALPILHTTKISVSHNAMVLRTTDTEVRMSVTVQCAHEGKWAGCVVNTKSLLDAVKGYDKGQVEFAVPDEDDKFVLSQDGAISDFETFKAEEFPPPADAKIDLSHVISLTREQVTESFKWVRDHYTLDDSRPVLCGVQFEAGSTLKVAASDGFTMGVFNTKKIPHAAKPKLIRGKGGPIVPGASLKLLASVLPKKTTGDVVVKTDKNNKGFGRCARFLWQETDRIAASLTTTLIQGTFPDYVKLIPRSSDTTFTIDIDDIAKRVQPVFALAQQELGQQAPVRVQVDEDGVEFYFGSGKTKRQVKHLCKPTLGELSNGNKNDKIALNAKLLKQMFKTYKGQTVKVGMTTPSSPIIATRADEIGETTLVMMPMFVQW